MSCCLSIEIMMCSGSLALAGRSAFSSAAGFSFSFSLRAAVAAGAGRAGRTMLGWLYPGIATGWLELLNQNAPAGVADTASKAIPAVAAALRKPILG